MKRATPAQRFWAKVASRKDGECWPWTAARTRKGYGRFRLGSRTIPAHRWAYEALVGPIPSGLVIDHLCRVRHCVNPAHLEPVTGRINCLRGVGPVAQQARQTACKRGHPFDDANTYWWRGRRICRTCRHAYRMRGLAVAR